MINEKSRLACARKPQSSDGSVILSTNKQTARYRGEAGTTDQNQPNVTDLTTMAELTLRAGTISRMDAMPYDKTAKSERFSVENLQAGCIIPAHHAAP